MIDSSELSKTIGEINKSVKDKIDILRKKEEKALQDLWENRNTEKEWEKIAKISEEYLKTTRDLTIGIRLAEAYTILEGINGMKRGIEILIALWDNSYPKTNDERQEIVRWIGKNLPNTLYVNQEIKWLLDEGVPEEFFVELSKTSTETIEMVKKFKNFQSESFTKSIMNVLEVIKSKVNYVNLNTEEVVALIEEIRQKAQKILEINNKNTVAPKILEILDNKNNFSPKK